jgi:prevent-host-death family protein
MSEMIVGIRELKAHLGRYLRRVKAGESLVITVRGEPVGRIVPTAPPTPASLEARIRDMVAAGLAEWNGQPYMPGEPVAVNRGPRCVSDLLVEDREPEWWDYALPGAQP